MACRKKTKCNSFIPDKSIFKNFDENSSISKEFLLKLITYIFEILSNVKIKTETNKLIKKFLLINLDIIKNALGKGQCLTSSIPDTSSLQPWSFELLFQNFPNKRLLHLK